MEYLEEIIYPVVDKFNLEYLNSDRIKKSPETVLFSGSGEGLDSIELVAFIVAIEDYISDFSGKEITLADEKAMSRRNSPFRDLNSLSKYISEVM